METQNKAEMDDIMSSFRQLQEKSAVNTKSFRVASMNEYLEKAKLLPPLVVLYPNIVLEGDLCTELGNNVLKKFRVVVQLLLSDSCPTLTPY